MSDMLRTDEFDTWFSTTMRHLGAVNGACLLPTNVDRTVLTRRFTDWIATDHNADLPAYVTDTADQRTDPFGSRPWARAAIAVTYSGDWNTVNARLDLPAPSPDGLTGRISAYACGRDYHQVGRQLLDRFTVLLQDRLGKDVEHEICVDTAPVPEVYMAVTGGLGCLGRNGLLRTPQTGSRAFMGILFVSEPLPELQRSVPDLTPLCVDCDVCVRSCPTQALTGAGMLRVGRCRSYLSIETKGSLSLAQQRLLGDALFGCDACTACCPPIDSVRPGQSVDLEWLLKTSSAEVRRRIVGTALEHAGVTRLKRNAVAILRNDGRPQALDVIKWTAENSGSEIVRQTALAK